MQSSAQQERLSRKNQGIWEPVGKFLDSCNGPPAGVGQGMLFWPRS